VKDGSFLNQLHREGTVLFKPAVSQTQTKTCSCLFVFVFFVRLNWCVIGLGQKTGRKKLFL